jgi:hypothetical protein
MKKTKLQKRSKLNLHCETLRQLESENLHSEKLVAIRGGLSVGCETNGCTNNCTGQKCQVW